MGEKCDAKGIKQNVNRVGKISNEVLKLVVINDYECVRRCMSYLTFSPCLLLNILPGSGSLLWILQRLTCIECSVTQQAS